MLNPLIYALRMRHIRASVAALLSTMCLRGLKPSLNPLAMGLTNVDSDLQSRTSSRRCTHLLQRLNSDMSESPTNGSVRNGSIEIHQLRHSKRSASVAGTANIRSGTAGGFRRRPSTFDGKGEWGRLLGARPHRHVK